VLLVDHLEFAVKLVHGSNQPVPLPSQLLECINIYNRLGSGIGHLLVGHSELLYQLLTPSQLFETVILAAIHEELRRGNVSGVPRKGTRIKDTDVPYLAGWDANVHSTPSMADKVSETPCHSISSISSPRARITAAASRDS
jgi:hypothetical protein